MLRRFILAFLIGVSLSMSAQMTPRSVVMTAPEMVQLTIDPSTMLDMLDYYDNGVARTMKNKMGEDAVITSLTPSSISIKTGEAHTLSLSILPYGKSEIIMVIDRVDTPSPDVAISFYDSRWNRLDDKKLFQMPTLSDWVGKVSGQRKRDIENALPFLMVDAEYEPDSRQLLLNPQIGDYVATEDADMVKEAIKPMLVYVWTGKSFKPMIK